MAIITRDAWSQDAAIRWITVFERFGIRIVAVLPPDANLVDHRHRESPGSNRWRVIGQAEQIDAERIDHEARFEQMGLTQGDECYG